MLLGFLEGFGGVDTHFWMFLGATSCVGLAFWLLVLTRDNIAHRLLVIQVFFDLLSFPVLTKMTSVFWCTAADVASSAASSDGSQRLFCDLGTTVPIANAQCMDNDPTAVCWEGAHLGYVITVMLILVPYYLAMLYLQAVAQSHQSVVVIGGAWNIIITQFKFALAIIASSFGGCHPHVMVGSILLVVGSQLLIYWHGSAYSSVHPLNAVRFGGLLCALANGLFAAFVLWHYRDDPAGAPPCSKLFNMSNNVSSAQMELSSSGSGSAGEEGQLQLVQSYGTFLGLLAVNATAIASGYGWYRCKKAGWEAHPDHGDHDSQFTDLDSVNAEEVAREVDYGTIMSRLRGLERLARKEGSTGDIEAVSDRDGTEEEDSSAALFVFDLHTQELWNDGGQQIEMTTLKAVLGHPLLAAPCRGVRLLDLDLDTNSSVLALKLLECQAHDRTHLFKVLDLSDACCIKKRLARIVNVKFSPTMESAIASDAAGTMASMSLLANQLPASLPLMLAVVEQHGTALRLASAELRGDPKVALTAVQQNFEALKFASDMLRQDKAFVLAAVRHHGSALEHATVSLQGDWDVVLAAVQQAGSAVQHASEALRGNKELLLAAVQQDGWALEHASLELQSDREVVLAAVRQAVAVPSITVQSVLEQGWGVGASSLTASACRRNDKEVVLLAVQQAGSALVSASKALRNNREVVLAAVLQDGTSLYFASDELQSDVELCRVHREAALVAVERDAQAQEVLSKALHSDRAAVLQKSMAYTHALQELRSE